MKYRFQVIKATSLLLITGAFASIHGQTGSQTVTFSYDGPPVSIPPDSADTAAVAEIFVPTALRIESVRVQLIVSYPAIGDLEIYLVSPEGDRIDFLDNDCGGLMNVNTTFDDAAPTEFDDFCPAEAGRGPFRPQEPLSNLRGELSTGYWNLFVVNTEDDDRAGSIRAVTLSITGTPITTPSFSPSLITNAARADGGVIAPGELVSVYGVALGPETGVRASSLPLPTSLGGTTVLVNGTAAPILYASALRVDFQAPFTLTPGTVASVQVQYGGQSSASTQIEVVSAFAGVFTIQTNGAGQAVARNQDGTVNSSAEPAARGSFVSLYATGLGGTTPGATAGTAGPRSPLARVDDVAVLVGGVPANVTFAGLAPGLVGTYQINFQVPSNLVTGARSVVVLPPRGFPSQARAFIFVD